MIKIGFLNFKREYAEKVAERFLAVKKAPAFMSVRGPFVNSDNEETVQTITIYEYGEDCAIEAEAYIEARYRIFNQLQELDIRVDEFLDIESAFNLLEGEYSFDALKTF